MRYGKTIFRRIRKSITRDEIFFPTIRYCCLGWWCTGLSWIKYQTVVCLFIGWFLNLDPFALRNSITYFNNNKEDSAKSAYERLHSVDFDLSKPRCDRTKPSLYWLEISKENQGHKVPMTTNLWYGRPNRVQVDFPGTKFNRSSKMQEFYIRCGFSLVSGEENGSFC